MRNARKLMSVALSAILITMISFSGCKPEIPPVPDPIFVPTVKTVSIENITIKSALVRADIIADGGSDIIDAGICWRQGEIMPSIDGSGNTVIKTSVSSGPFSLTIDLFLEPDTKYSVRAFARNKEGLAYGDSLSFTTKALTPQPATVSTDTLISFGTHSAVVSGKIISNGGWEITAAGICWSTNTDPSIADNLVPLSTAIGAFNASLNDLELITDYYCRTYATNAAGTVYGRVIPLTTLDSVVDADGNSYYGIKIGNQVWLTSNLKVTHFNNGEEIPYVTGNSAWSNLSGSAYSWYNNDESRSLGPFGALYNWWVAADPRGVAPPGYHIPSAQDFMTLGDHFGLDTILIVEGEEFVWRYRGGMAICSQTTWVPAVLLGNNNSGFNALPGGFRFMDGGYVSRLSRANWWASNEYDSSAGWNMYTGGDMKHDYFWVTGKWIDKNIGKSLRCLKD